MSADQKKIKRVLRHARDMALRYREANREADDKGSLRHVPTARVFKAKKRLRKALWRVPDALFNHLHAAVQHDASAPMPIDEKPTLSDVIEADNLAECLDKMLSKISDESQ